MDGDVTQNNLSAQKIREQFDKVVAHHLERLTGTRIGINELPLNLITISCIVLLVERENEIKTFSLDNSARYTDKGLVEELMDMGHEYGQDLQTAVQEMSQKDYIIRESDDYLSATSTARSMSQLLDLLFKDMAGMNLVAYLMQLFSEVKMGQKTLGLAVDSVDQTLKLHGVPQGKRTVSKPPEHVSRQFVEDQTRLRKEDAKKDDRGRESGHKLSIAKLRKALAHTHAGRRTKSSGPKILGSGGVIKQIRAKDSYASKQRPAPQAPTQKSDRPDIPAPPREVEPPEAAPKAGRAEPAAKIMAETPVAKPEPSHEPLPIIVEPPKEDAAQDKAETVSEELSAPDLIDEPTEETQTTEPKEALATPYEEAFVVPIEPLPEESEKETASIETPQEIEPVQDTAVQKTVGDGDILDKISAFQKDLAINCPVCQIGEIHAEKTASDKSYYICSNPNCNFVSWGKPYFIPCPKCNSPFLVETVNNSGKSILECVNSACFYTQPLPGQEEEPIGATTTPKPSKLKEKNAAKPKRKVIRRRVVRRKK